MRPVGLSLALIGLLGATLGTAQAVRQGTELGLEAAVVPRPDRRALARDHPLGRDGRGDQDRTRGALDALMTDGAQQQTGQGAVPGCAEDQQLS